MEKYQTKLRFRMSCDFCNNWQQGRSQRYTEDFLHYRIQDQIPDFVNKEQYINLFLQYVNLAFKDQHPTRNLNFTSAFKNNIRLQLEDNGIVIRVLTPPFRFDRENYTFDLQN